jgi:hypothetical protein
MNEIRKIYSALKAVLPVEEDDVFPMCGFGDVAVHLKDANEGDSLLCDSTLNSLGYHLSDWEEDEDITVRTYKKVRKN